MSDALANSRRPVDLRTDTCTHPTPEMYEAMRTAPLGDDGWRDDPTVLELEERTAALLGKEAGLFMPSGTMADLVALMSLNKRFGGELIAHARAWVTGPASHGGFATISGLAPHPVDGPRGAMDLDVLAETIEPEGNHRAPFTAVISIENTHTSDNGAVLPLAHMQSVYRMASERGLPVFLDGARLPHAAAALNVSLAELAKYGDVVSMSVCKALGAPAGSMLAGSREMIDQALIYRKLLGGAMRQSGLLAACALLAIQTPLSVIRDYHDLAARLARGMAAIDPRFIDRAEVETNLLTPDISWTGLNVPEWVASLAARDILVAPAGSRHLRLLTHSEVDAEAVDRAIAAFADVLSDHGRPKA